MASFLNKIMKHGDEDEELDMEFDIAESDCFELPPDRQDNQVLAVWGSPSSGKTIMSVKIARYIAAQKNECRTFSPLSFVVEVVERKYTAVYFNHMNGGDIIICSTNELL